MTDPATVFSWQLIYNLINLEVYSGAAGGCISPLSLYLALVLALNGAGPLSQTQRQLWTVLNGSQQTPTTQSTQLPYVEAQLNNRTVAILAGLLAQGSSNNTQISIANGVWAFKRPIKETYADRMWRVYKAQVQTVDTTDPINTWAIIATAGRITEAVPIGARFLLLLTNAVYFHVQWQYPFDHHNTKLQPFQTISNGTRRIVRVPIMSRNFKSFDITGDRQIYYGNLTGHLRAVKLPYRNSNMSAVLLLPDQQRYGLDVDAAVMDLARMQLMTRIKWRTVYQIGRLELQMPKFKLQSKQVSVKQALRAMNVTAAFTKGQANFSRISDEPMYITDILQSTYLEVDESGTEAAAVTAFKLVTTSYDPSVQRLVFDRPFIFLVVDDKTDLVMFQAIVKDPSLAV